MTYHSLNEQKKQIDDFLDKHLPKKNNNTNPNSLIQAMRYSVFAGGKRIRPIISMVVNDMLGGNNNDILFPAAAIELIHTYSLIHDDLPALDNDDFRRGKPSCHKQFGEAVALLAGDALLTLAFNWLSKINNKNSIHIIQTVSKAASNMINGQIIDLEMTGSIHSNNNNLENNLLYIHKNKTAAIIQSAVITGALSANTNKDILNKLAIVGNNIGLAFQIIDDILDIEGDTKILGKTKGKDQKNQKLTFPSIYGIKLSKQKAEKLIKQSKNILNQFNKKQKLIEIIDLIFSRNN